MRKKKLVILMIIAFSLILCNNARAEYSITISKASNKLALYNDNTLLRVFPVATGRHPSYTPEGRFKIACKLVDPYYCKKRIAGGNPRNPLGSRWLGLNIGGGGVYGIHGTNTPSSIGTYASGGCIRMYSKDAIWLSEKIKVGTPVTINNIPFKKPVNFNFITMEVKHQQIDLPQSRQPLQKQNDIFIPLRVTAEKLGYRVNWNSNTNTIVLQKNARKLLVNPGKQSMIINNNSYSTKALFIQNHLFLPLNHFNRIPGITANWDRQARKAVVFNN